MAVELPKNFGKEGRGLYAGSGDKADLYEILETIYDRLNDLKGAVVTEVSSGETFGTAIRALADLELED